MNSPDAYFHSDAIYEACIDQSEAYNDWLELTAMQIVERWKSELKADDHIADLDLDGADITALGVERQLPVEQILFSLAWKFADESGLYEELSWS